MIKYDFLAYPMGRAENEPSDGAGLDMGNEPSHTLIARVKW